MNRPFISLFTIVMLSVVTLRIGASQTPQQPHENRTTCSDNPQGIQQASGNKSTRTALPHCCSKRLDVYPVIYVNGDPVRKQRFDANQKDPRYT